jgi:pre-rRNA-processing protein TSR1
MAPTQVHHHRSTTKVSQKPFKTKHASKSALKEKAKGKDDMKDFPNSEILLCMY